MRQVLRAHRGASLRRVLIAVIATVVATVTVSSVGLGGPAVAQPPPPAFLAAAAAIAAGVQAPPMTPAQKSALLLAGAQRLNRLEVLRVQAVRAQRIKALRTRVVALARRQLGDSYSAGATGPDRFDCSGLTRFVFRVAAGKDLPHQSHAQYGRVTRVSRAKALPGDLVFFFRNGAHHVGIYIGGGRMIDAAGYGKGVRVSPISGSWWGRTFSGIGRVLPAA